MKAKKTPPPRRRISFAVDREEIEINSDWVDAVMAPPPTASVVPFPAPSPEVVSSQPADTPVFLGPESNTATDELSAPGAGCAPVVDNFAVAAIAPVEYGASVALSATVSVSAKDHRRPRRRPILRVTDGLTPGQFAVYSLMYEAGAKTDDSARIYKGGYADLGRLTGLSKRGLQNIIAELQVKQVIQLHQQPGYHRTQTSAYLVPASEAVLRVWQDKGWRYALGKSKTLTL